jgi:hypothetical protein
MTEAIYLLLADLVLFTHVLVVVFVVLGLIMILAGGVLKWTWVHNPWFRLAHLACISIVVMQAWAGVICPLTTLEMWLRAQAGAQIYSGSFIAHWLDSILYYDLPSWLFTLAYSSFGALVLVSWFWIRPRRLFARKLTGP